MPQTTRNKTLRKIRKKQEILEQLYSCISRKSANLLQDDIRSISEALIFLLEAS